MEKVFYIIFMIFMLWIVNFIAGPFVMVGFAIGLMIHKVIELDERVKSWEDRDD